MSMPRQACDQNGQNIMQGCRVLVDEEMGPTLPTIVCNAFSQLRSLDALNVTQQKVAST